MWVGGGWGGGGGGKAETGYPSPSVKNRQSCIYSKYSDHSICLAEHSTRSLQFATPSQHEDISDMGYSNRPAQKDH